jgi:hypothetical protein
LETRGVRKVVASWETKSRGAYGEQGKVEFEKGPVGVLRRRGKMTTSLILSDVEATTKRADA